MLLRAALAALVAAALFSACGSSNDYDTGLADEDYDLAAMVIPESGVPEGLLEQLSESFDNEEWAAVTGEDDPEGKLKQLEAQGRLRSHIALFGREDPTLELARVLSVTSQSTLYVDEAAAEESANTLCGLLISDAEAATVDDFAVPKLGDQSAGFFITKTELGVGKAIDTTVCFRTGRIVHAIVQTGFSGSEDIGLSVRMAQDVLKRVEDVFAGRISSADGEEPGTEEDEEG